MKKGLLSFILCTMFGIGTAACAEPQCMDAAFPAAARPAKAGAGQSSTVQNPADWRLVLVNAAHPVGDFTPPELITLRNGVRVDARIYPDLQQMFDDMRAEGLSPIAGEGFRTFDEQCEMMCGRIREYRRKGYSRTESESMARAYVAEPGTSEHQLGLAVDINSENGDHQSVYEWLAARAHEYGFILRYPQGGESVTGYAYEPWHYRYVGREAAQEITGSGMTLEEYLGADD